ncbi:MAG TPA: TIGR02587 family membrane protein [Nitrospiraceae bacterium]|nr:TIGR02587 family membrane protein [Nitrospiraceae bacterium]
MDIQARSHNESDNRSFVRGLGRAFGGALIFSFPMLLTGETWWLGFSMDRFRLIVLLILLLPLLVGLSYFQGFERTFGWKDDLLDAFVAYGVGFVLAATLLPLFSIIEPSMSLNEIVGKLAIQAVPGSIGALLVRSQLGGPKEETRQKRARAGYGGEIFLMVVGAVYLALNLAPTHELVLLSQMVTWRQAIGLVIATLIVTQPSPTRLTSRRRAQNRFRPGVRFFGSR